MTVERSNQTLNEMLNRQKGSTRTPKYRLHSALLTLNFLNANEQNTTAVERHWIVERTVELNQAVYIKDILTSEWKMGNVLCWGKGYVCFHRKRKAMGSFQVDKRKTS